jgi:cyclopropane fatty-acyl-phospholipid synthase-like methyltransferase
MEDFWKLRKGIIHDDLGFQYSADWYADKYHWNPPEGQMVDLGPGQYKERDTELLLAMEIKDGDSILVPGCSEANNISLLKSMYKGLHITGVDWSETAVRFCRHAFPEYAFRQNGIADLFLEDGSFNHILAIDFTEHLSLADYVAFLAKCYPVLCSGGTLGILPGMSVRPEHINLMYPPTIAQHAEQQGFEITAVGSQWLVGKKPEGR